MLVLVWRSCRRGSERLGGVVPEGLIGRCFLVWWRMVVVALKGRYVKQTVL